MHIPVEVEFDYKNSGPQVVPANTTQDFDFPQIEGWTGISWGFQAVHPILEFQTCSYVLGEDGRQHFVATVRNPSATDRSIRFTFLLIKA